jgi:polyhydroxyalkanoate synthesis regulator phasin
MNAERKKVLEMLADGKISADEAERLLETLEDRTAEASPATALAQTGLPRYLFVKVDSSSGDKVNIRVPMKLIQAGIKLKSLLPREAQDKINAQLSEKGINLDDFDTENLKDLLDALTELEVNVDDKKGDKVRIYCSNA